MQFPYQEHLQQLRLRVRRAKVSVSSCAPPGNRCEWSGFRELPVPESLDRLASFQGGLSEVDEYEQTFLSLKLSKQLSDRFDVSLQYGYSRNGATSLGSFYKKHTYTILIDAAL